MWERILSYSGSLQDDSSRISWLQWYQFKFNRSRLKLAMEALNTIMSLISVSVYVYDTYISIDQVARTTYFVCSWTFAVEYVAKFLAAQDHLRYLLWDWSLIDVATIVYGIVYFADGSMSQDFGFVRLLRIIQAVRLCKAVTTIVLQYSRRTSQPMQLEYVRRSSDLAVTLVAVVFISACVFYEMEAGHDDLYLHNALYWACVTISTVGYGDYSPSTVAGQLLFPLIIVVIILILPRKIGDLSDVLQSYSRFKRRSHRSRRFGQHVVLTGHINPVSAHTFISEFYHQGRGYQELEVVILAPHDPAPELVITMNKPRWEKRVRYLNGSPFRAEDLARADTGRALAVFVLANKYDTNPAAQDTRTLLCVLAIAQFLRQFGSPEDLPVTRAVSWSTTSWKGRLNQVASFAHPHIIAQFLLNETLNDAVALLQTGAQHPPEIGLMPLNISPFPVCVGNLRAALLGASLHTPGLITLICNLCISCCLERNTLFRKEDVTMLDSCGWLSEYLSGAAVEIYDVTFPKPYWGCNFKQAALQLWREEQVILIGVRFPCHEDPEERFDVKLAPLAACGPLESPPGYPGRDGDRERFGGGDDAVGPRCHHEALPSGLLIDEHTVGYILSTDALVLGSTSRGFKSAYDAQEEAGAPDSTGTTYLRHQQLLQQQHPSHLSQPPQQRPSAGGGGCRAGGASGAGGGGAGVGIGGGRARGGGKTAYSSSAPSGVIGVSGTLQARGTPAHPQPAVPAVCLPHGQNAGYADIAARTSPGDPPPQTSPNRPTTATIATAVVETSAIAAATAASQAGPTSRARGVHGPSAGGAAHAATSAGRHALRSLSTPGWRHSPAASPAAEGPANVAAPAAYNRVAVQPTAVAATAAAGGRESCLPGGVTLGEQGAEAASSSLAVHGLDAQGTRGSVARGIPIAGGRITTTGRPSHWIFRQSRAVVRIFSHRTAEDLAKSSTSIAGRPADGDSGSGGGGGGAATASGTAPLLSDVGRSFITMGQRLLSLASFRPATAAAGGGGGAGGEAAGAADGAAAAAATPAKPPGFTSTRLQQGFKVATRGMDLQALAAMSSFTQRRRVAVRRLSRQCGGSGSSRRDIMPEEEAEEEAEDGTRTTGSCRQSAEASSSKAPSPPRVVHTLEDRPPLESPVIISGSSCFRHLPQVLAAIRAAPPMGRARRFATCPIIILDDGSSQASLAGNHLESLAGFAGVAPEAAVWVLRANPQDPLELRKMNLKPGKQVEALVVPPMELYDEEAVVGAAPAMADGQVLLAANALRSYCEEIDCDLRLTTEMLALLNCSYALPLCLAEGPYHRLSGPDGLLAGELPPRTYSLNSQRPVNFVTDPRPDFRRTLRQAFGGLHPSQVLQEDFVQYVLSRMPHLTPSLAPGHILMQTFMDALSCQTIFNPMMLQILLKMIDCWDNNAGQQVAQRQHHHQRQQQPKHHHQRHRCPWLERPSVPAPSDPMRGPPPDATIVTTTTTTSSSRSGSDLLSSSHSSGLVGGGEDSAAAAREDATPAQMQGGCDGESDRQQPEQRRRQRGPYPPLQEPAYHSDRSPQHRRGQSRSPQEEQLRQEQALDHEREQQQEQLEGQRQSPLTGDPPPDSLEQPWDNRRLLHPVPAAFPRSARLPSDSGEGTADCSVVALSLYPPQPPPGPTGVDVASSGPIAVRQLSTGSRNGVAAGDDDDDDDDGGGGDVYSIQLRARLPPPPQAVAPRPLAPKALLPEGWELMAQRAAQACPPAAGAVAALPLGGPGLDAVREQHPDGPRLRESPPPPQPPALRSDEGGAGSAGFPAASSRGDGGVGSGGGSANSGPGPAHASAPVPVPSNTVRVICLNFQLLCERVMGLKDDLRAAQQRERRRRQMAAAVAARARGDGGAAVELAAVLLDTRDMQVSTNASGQLFAVTFGVLFEVLVRQYNMMPLGLYRRDIGVDAHVEDELPYHHAAVRRHRSTQDTANVMAAVGGCCGGGFLGPGEAADFTPPSRRGPLGRGSGIPYVYTKPERDTTWMRPSDDVYVLASEAVVMRWVGQEPC